MRTLQPIAVNSPQKDPYIQMAKNVEQRKEYDLMEWNDDIQGSE